jgi:hypothetical protein
MKITEIARRKLVVYRVFLAISLFLIAYFIQYSYSVMIWIAFLIVIGKLYEIFFLRGGRRWDSDPVSLNLMVVLKFAEYVWNGFARSN